MTIWPNGESIFHSTSTLPHVLTKQSLCCSLVAKSYLTLVTAWAVVCLAPLSMGFSRHSPGLSMATEVGCHALLQGIVLTQGSNLGLLPCRWIVYHLSYQGSFLKYWSFLILFFIFLFIMNTFHCSVCDPWVISSACMISSPISLLLLFSRSVASSSLEPMDCSTPGFPVLHYL